MKRRLSHLAAGLAGVATILWLALPTAGAVASSSGDGGNGLKVSPVVTNIVINPGQSQVVDVSVQNVTQTDVTLQVLVNDFTASTDESGAPALLLDPGQYAPSHSLKRFIPPISNIMVKAGQQQVVPVTIAVPQNAPGGGYYGAVRFAAAATNGNNNVTLSASVGSLILVKVPGNIKEDLSLVSFGAASPDNSTHVVFTSGKGLLASVRFRNSGDVQEQPFGKVLLESGGKQLAAYELNDATPRGNVLPDSIRRFTVNLDKVGSLGKYTLVGNFGYGSSGQLLSGTTTFYVIPIWGIVIVLLILGLIAFFIFGFPRLLRAYNERVIRAAKGR